MKVIARQVKPSMASRAPEMFSRAGTQVNSESREVLCDLAGHLPQSSFAWSLDVANCPQPLGWHHPPSIAFLFLSELFQIKHNFTAPY